LIVLAAPDVRPVPTDAMINVVKSTGAGAMAYPAIVVMTTKTERTADY